MDCRLSTRRFNGSMERPSMGPPHLVGTCQKVFLIVIYINANSSILFNDFAMVITLHDGMNESVNRGESWA